MENDHIRTGSTQYISPNARNGISLPILRADGVDYNIEEMERDQLMKLVAAIESDIDSITNQIAAARHDELECGETLDQAWEIKAGHARNIKRRQVQMLQAELAKRKRGQRPVEYYFVNLARERLDGFLFRSLLADATACREGDALGAV